MEAPLLATLVRRVHLAIRREIHAELHAAGFTDLTPAHIYLFQIPGPDGVRPGELAARTNMTKQAVNHLLSFLERQGYVARATAPEDGRGRVVRLTPRGRAVERRMQASAARVEVAWSESIGARRMTALKEALRRLDEAVVSSGSPPGR